MSPARVIVSGVLLLVLAGGAVAGHQGWQRYRSLIADRDRIEKEGTAAAAERDRLRGELDAAKALAAQLKERLEQLGQRVDSLKNEQGELNSGLAAARAHVEELRAQKAAAEARAAMFHDLVEKLRAMIDAGQLKVAIREGRMLIALPDDILFDSGKTDIKPEGQQAIAKVAKVLAALPDRSFLVAGHTDNVPVKGRRFRSNWDLSVARAVEVTHLLIENGMRPGALAAAGYGEFSPVGPNDTPEQRTLNRRIEIVLQPNLRELPQDPPPEPRPEKP